MAEGHPNARHYRLGFMWSEARIAKQRINARVIENALLMQTVVATVMGGKKAQSNLNKQIKQVENSD